MSGYKLLMLASASILLHLGCQQSPSAVKFIVPDGYTGPVIMRHNQPDGLELPVQDGAYIVEFPVEGEISVQGHPLGDGFRIWRACYQGGDPLRIENFLDEAEPGTVAFFPLGTRGVGEESRSVYYIGTPEEVREWLSDQLFSL